MNATEMCELDALATKYPMRN